MLQQVNQPTTLGNLTKEAIDLARFLWMEGSPNFDFPDDEYEIKENQILLPETGILDQKGSAEPSPVLGTDSSKKIKQPGNKSKRRKRAAGKPQKKRKTPKEVVVPIEEESSYINRTNWSHKEEVFLVGAILERFFRVGSLTSKPGSSRNKEANECWQGIKAIYDHAWDKHAFFTNISAPHERSTNALARHYKVMKANIKKPGYNGKDLRGFWDEFQSKYNAGNHLFREL